MSRIDLEMALQSLISSDMVRPLSWPCAVYPEFVLSIGYSGGYLDLKYGELRVMSLFSKDEAKLQTEMSRAFQFLYVQKCSDIKSNNLSHWNMSRIISMTGDFLLK